MFVNKKSKSIKKKSQKREKDERNANLQQIFDISWPEHHDRDENDGVRRNKAVIHDELEIITKRVTSLIKKRQHENKNNENNFVTRRCHCVNTREKKGAT